MIESIVNLRKHHPDGLRSFNTISRILDRFNQKYTGPHQKFDAIVAFGVDENDKHNGNKNDMAMPDFGEDAVELYQVLTEIAVKKLDFDNANDRIQGIYEEAIHLRNSYK